MGKVKEDLEVDPNLISHLILEALHFTKAGLNMDRIKLGNEGICTG